MILGVTEVPSEIQDFEAEAEADDWAYLIVDRHLAEMADLDTCWCSAGAM